MFRSSLRLLRSRSRRMHIWSCSGVHGQAASLLRARALNASSTPHAAALILRTTRGGADAATPQSGCRGHSAQARAGSRSRHAAVAQRNSPARPVLRVSTRPPSGCGNAFLQRCLSLAASALPAPHLKEVPRRPELGFGVLLPRRPAEQPGEYVGHSGETPPPARPAQHDFRSTQVSETSPRHFQLLYPAAIIAEDRIL